MPVLVLAVAVLVLLFATAVAQALARDAGQDRRLVAGLLLEVRPSRSWARVRASSRDTCICEMPSSAAICDWVMFPKNRSSRIRRSRAGSESSSGLSDSRYSTPSSASSSAPSVSATGQRRPSPSLASSETVV